MSTLYVILAAFATYYTALIIAEEDGPFGFFDKLRQRLNAGYLGKGIRCVVCVSAYTGCFWAIVLSLFGYVDVWLWPLVGFGLAGASVLISRVWKR